MSSDRYPRYGIAAVAAGVIALWAGVPLTFMLLFVACPLMMFFMMRGTRSGDSAPGSHRADAESVYPPTRWRRDAPDALRPLDGSHERIDNP